MFVLFLDVHSGGDQKTLFHSIYVEAGTEEEAKEIFKSHLQRDPDHVTCQCCGADYVCIEFDTLDQATAQDRGCESLPDDSDWDLTTAKMSVEEYIKQTDVLVIYA